jgi:hypothetical protein
LSHALPSSSRLANFSGNYARILIDADNSPIGRRFHPKCASFGVFDKSDDPPPFVDWRRAAQFLAEQALLHEPADLPLACCSARSFIVHFKSESVDREPANDNDLALMRRIDEFFVAWPFLRSRRMTAMRRAEGETPA